MDEQTNELKEYNVVIGDSTDDALSITSVVRAKTASDAVDLARKALAPLAHMELQHGVEGVSPWHVWVRFKYLDISNISVDE